MKTAEILQCTSLPTAVQTAQERIVLGMSYKSWATGSLNKLSYRQTPNENQPSVIPAKQKQLQQWFYKGTAWEN